jgi:hypothetical protein
MRKSGEPVAWVVYQMLLAKKPEAMNVVCEQGEWDAMELARPGLPAGPRSAPASWTGQRGPPSGPRRGESVPLGGSARRQEGHGTREPCYATWDGGSRDSRAGRTRRLVRCADPVSLNSAPSRSLRHMPYNVEVLG